MFSTSSLISLLARSRSGERCPNEANIHKYITSHLHIAMAGGERRKKTSTGSEGCKNKKSPSSSAARQMTELSIIGKKARLPATARDGWHEACKSERDEDTKLRSILFANVGLQNVTRHYASECKTHEKTTVTVLKDITCLPVYIGATHNVPERCTCNMCNISLTTSIAHNMFRQISSSIASLQPPLCFLPPSPLTPFFNSCPPPRFWRLLPPLLAARRVSLKSSITADGIHLHTLNCNFQTITYWNKLFAFFRSLPSLLLHIYSPLFFLVYSCARQID